MADTDSLQKFLFSNIPVRGEIVHLNNSYLAVLDRHPYPGTVQTVLGETLVATTLLSSILKFSGSLILQVQSKGPLKLLVAQANHRRHIRGLAQWKDDISENGIKKSLEQGQLAITICPEESHRYQGIVELKGSLAQSIETYFAQSEQLPTFIYLAADEQVAAGLLLQVLPGSYDVNPEIAWEHLTQLSRTLTAEEMLYLSNQEILKRLFHEEDVELFDSQAVIFYCDCSRERMERAIFILGKKDALELVKKEKIVRVICEFCNRHHDFDLIDVAKIFPDQ